MKHAMLPSYSAPKPAPTLEDIRRFEPRIVQLEELRPLGDAMRMDFSALIWTAARADSTEAQNKAGEMLAMIMAQIVRHGGNLKATLTNDVYKISQTNKGFIRQWKRGKKQGQRLAKSPREVHPPTQALRESLIDILDEVLPYDFRSKATDFLLTEKLAGVGTQTIDARLSKYALWVKPKVGNLKELRKLRKHAKTLAERLSIRGELLWSIHEATADNADDFFEVFIKPRASELIQNEYTHPFNRNYKLINNPDVRNAKLPMAKSKLLRQMKVLLREFLNSF